MLLEASLNSSKLSPVVDGVKWLAFPNYQ